MAPKPDITLHDTDPHFQATKRHFDRCVGGEDKENTTVLHEIYFSFWLNVSSHRSLSCSIYVTRRAVASDCSNKCRLLRRLGGVMEEAREVA